MKRYERYFILGMGVFILFALVALGTESYAFGGFESRMKSLNQSLISVVLPLVSVLGLVYAAILAVTGDGAARGRMTMVIVASILGFLAGPIIRWIQGTMGY